MSRAAALVGERYTRVAMWLHWVIAALVVANLTIGILHDPVPAFGALMPAHKAIGLTVLVLTLARIGWRLAYRAPPLPASVSPLKRVAANVVHGVLYLLLLAVPLTGWALVSGMPRRPLGWFGLFPLPYLPVSSATADAADQAHGVLGWLMLGLVVIHVVAALHHRFVLRDGVLARMAPALERETAGLPVL